MSSRSTATELTRLLYDLAAPVCVFDEDRRLVFANSACAEWAGVPLEKLVGQVGSYTSATHDNETAAVDRLCPPPDAFAGRRQCAVVYAIAPEGRLRPRRAEFVPLGDSTAGSAAPVLVLVSPMDLSAADSPAVTDGVALDRASDEAAVLHDRLARFHYEQCGRYRLDRLVGDSLAMQLARSQALAAIAGRSNVAIVGPSGSGREDLARTIHYNGTAAAINHQAVRRQESLMVLDGSLLTDDVLTSAASALAAQGRGTLATILLLHIDRLPPEIQPEIVRLFVQRGGGMRLLTTSEVPPDTLTAQGRLHPSLAAAISTIVIRLPALAERRDDIPLLAQRLVEELNAERKKQVRGFSAEAIDAVVAYSWPGNVAELRDFVAEAFYRTEGIEITLADLPRRLSHAAGAARRPARALESIVLEEFLADIERELIERALKQAKGNKARAARLLGLTRPRLYRRMVHLGLEEAVDGDASPARDVRGTRDTAPAAKQRRHRERATVVTDSDDEDKPATAPAAESAEFIEDIPFEEQPE